MDPVSNILDIPRKHGQEDFLGIDEYGKALEKFITIAASPMTVAIQGEWGSGKTSMMNQIRGRLCEEKKFIIRFGLTHGNTLFL